MTCDSKINLYCVAFLLWFSSFYVPYVASFTRLSIFDCPSDILKRLFTIVYSLTNLNGKHDKMFYYLLCPPFRNTRVRPRFLVGFVLLDLQFYVYILQIVVCPFVFFLLAIVLSVLLRFTDSDDLFGFFNLFLI